MRSRSSAGIDEGLGQRDLALDIRAAVIFLRLPPIVMTAKDLEVGLLIRAALPEGQNVIDLESRAFRAAMFCGPKLAPIPSSIQDAITNGGWNRSAL